MTRENKLALIVGFCLVLVVGVLISDHFSRARSEPIGNDLTPGTAQNFGATSGGLAAPIGPAPSVRSSQPLVGIDQTPARAEAHAAEESRPRPPVEIHTSHAPGKPDGDTPAAGPSKKSSEKASGSIERPETGFAAVTAKKYEIKEGDSYYKIAKTIYGEAGIWEKLRDYNNTGDAPLRVGATLLLPPKEVLTGKPAPIQDPTGPRAKADSKPWTDDHSLIQLSPVKAKGKEKEPSKPMYAMYTVKRGDDLSKIAQGQLGSARRYHEILELNRDVIEDEESIRAGVTLKMPTK